jgi:ferrous iron transport protein B
MLLKNKPPAIVLVGQPNVGKSAIMNYLTGVGAMVSNFPGTTVEVTEGRLHYEGQHWRVIDTLGPIPCIPIQRSNRLPSVS